MATSPREASTARRAASNSGGPLMGWAWRHARLAMQFGKRQGAWAIDFRADRVRYYLDGHSASQAQSKQAKQRRDSSRREAEPPRRQSSQADGAQCALSTRKQKKLDRLLDFQRRKRLLLRMRHVLHKIVRRWRHQRMWDVHNAWIATRSAPAAAAGPPAPDIERMDEDGLTSAGPAEHDADAASPPLHESGAGSSSGGGLNPNARAFVPVQQTMEVEHEQQTPAYERQLQRQVVALQKERRAARKATRIATEAAEAARAAKHNANAVLRAHTLRTAVSKPLGLQAARAGLQHDAATATPIPPNRGPAAPRDTTDPSIATRAAARRFTLLTEL